MYSVSDSLMANNAVFNLHKENKAKLTTWILGQHRAGIQSPLISSSVLEEASQQRRLKYSEKKGNLFRELSFSRYKISEFMKVAGIVDEAHDYWTGMLGAWLEAEDDDERRALITALKEEGLFAGDQSIRLTAKGILALEEAEGGRSASNQAFVAMWFGDDMHSAYNNGIKPAIIAGGYSPLRIDQKQHNNKIDDEIVLEIKRSRFLVADFTSQVHPTNGEKLIVEARGGVYFEAGLAMGLGLPVIFMVQRRLIEHVHFDTRQYAHVVWDTPSDLKDALFARIGATIGLADKR